MFEKFIFSEGQVKRYYQSAIKDLRIASRADIPEVKFKFCYDALIKLAVTLCARNGLRVKARQGHHIELLHRLSDCLNNHDINVIGNEMRSKRNFDLYSGGVLISGKETQEYLIWLRRIFQQADDYLAKNQKLF